MCLTILDMKWLLDCLKPLYDWNHWSLNGKQANNRWRIPLCRFAKLDQLLMQYSFHFSISKAASFGCFILRLMLLSLSCHGFLEAEVISASEGWHHFIGEGLHELSLRVSQTNLVWDVHELQYVSERLSESHTFLLKYSTYSGLNCLQGWIEP